MTPEVVDREEFIVVGIRTVLELGADNIDILWKEQFLPRKDELKAVKKGFYGVFNFLPEDAGGRMEFVAGVVTDSLEDIPVGMVGWVIPVGTYAEVAAAGKDGVEKACREIMTDWLPESKYQRVTSPMFAYTADEAPYSPKAVWNVNIPIETPEEMAQYKNWLEGDKD